MVLSVGSEFCAYVFQNRNVLADDLEKWLVGDYVLMRNTVCEPQAISPATRKGFNVENLMTKKE